MLAVSFKWRDELTVGIKEIDNQHKKLLEIGDRIYQLAMLKDDYDHYDEIMEILDELKNYTLYHFNYEEQLMDKYSLDAAETHKFQHYFFVKKIQSIEKKDIDKAQDQAVIEILNFVSDWISSHILNTDKDYFVQLKNKGVS